MHPATPPALPLPVADDLPLPPLFQAIENQIRFMEANPSDQDLQFGKERFTRSEYLRALRRFLELGRDSRDSNELFERTKNEFNFQEVYGRDRPGEVFMTSYFEPVIPGSKHRTEQYSQPLYGVPQDLVQIRLQDFDPIKFENRTLRGRLTGNTVVPFYNRKEIDQDGLLRGRKLELCWVDPIDAFFLQVQGSGTVVFENGEKSLINYADKNGHPYEPVGKYFRGVIPPEQLNLHTIEAALRKLPKAELQNAMNTNPSYVFFRSLNQSALTFMGVPATDGRTIATDPKFFPKGALGFLIFEKPVFTDPADPLPARFEPASRFVLDQDIGGAITGGGRLDLFWGRGAEAKHNAGVMKNTGRLFYLTPKRP